MVVDVISYLNNWTVKKKILLLMLQCNLFSGLLLNFLKFKAEVVRDRFLAINNNEKICKVHDRIIIK
jgi:hypothetical protein